MGDQQNGGQKALTTPPRTDGAEAGGGCRKAPRRRRCVLCVVCTVAVLVVVAVVMLTLALTVYRVRGPEMWLNSITIPPGAGEGGNTTIVVDASVRNRNPVDYYFEDTETTFYYRGLILGEAGGAGGKAGARSTYRSNVTFSVPTDRVVRIVLGAGSPISDAVPIDSATKVEGHVKIFGLVKHRVDVAMNCSVAVAVANFSVLDQSCRQRVWI